MSSDKEAFQKEEAQGLLKAEDGEGSSSPPMHAAHSHDVVSKAAAAEDPKVTMLRTWWGTCYATAMSVCGIVLVALGSTLGSLAANCNTTSTAVGTVFIARGVGAILGAVSSARVYSPPRKGNMVMVVVLMVLAGVLLYMPFVDSILLLHVTWFGLGLCTATLDTGCQIMTRKVHGIFAGPWLGLNTVCFAIAGALVPLVEIITNDLFVQYAVLATVSALGAATLFASPHPEAPEIAANLPPRVKIGGRGSDGKKASREGGCLCFDKPYYHEWVFGCTVFWLIGGKVDMTSYIKTYVKDSGVIPAHQGSESLLMIWIMITIGRLVGLQDQIALKRKSTNTVYIHLTVWLMTGVIGMLCVVVDLKSPVLFWIGIALYGLGNGPCVGYCYDLINRLTTATEEGMSIVMFGLNFGASLVPYITTVIWDRTELQYYALMFITFISMLLPIPLIGLSMCITPRGFAIPPEFLHLFGRKPNPVTA